MKKEMMVMQSVQILSRSLRAASLILFMIHPLSFALGQEMLYFSGNEDAYVGGTLGLDTDLFSTELISLPANDIAALTTSLPRNSALDAVYVESTNSVYFSLDVDALLTGNVFADEDIIYWDGVNFAMAWDGTAHGLPAKPDGRSSLNLDALHVISTAPFEIYFSLDTDASINGTRFADDDLIAWQSGIFSLAWSGITGGISPSANLDGFEQRNASEWIFTFDTDGHTFSFPYDDSDLLLWDVPHSTFRSIWYDSIKNGIPNVYDMNAIGLEMSPLFNGVSNWDIFD